MQLFIDILCDMLILTVGSVVVLDGLFAVVDDLIRGKLRLLNLNLCYLSIFNSAIFKLILKLEPL